MTATAAVLRETAPRTVARTAGIGYLVIIVSGIFAEFFARGSLIVAGDAVATARNIAGSQLLFRAGLAGDLVMLIADVAVAVALYSLLRPVSRNLALFAMVLRIAHAATYAATLLTLYTPLLLLDGGGPPGALLTAESQTLLMLSLKLHATGYAVALLFFGVHCLAVGFVIVRSGIVPRAVGALLTIAGAGYLFDSFARTLLVNYGAMEPVFAVVVFAPALIGELTFCCWLLFKGVRPVSVG